MTTLGDVAKAAHRGLWSQTHGRHTLLRAVQDALHDFFVARGESMNVSPLAVDDSDVSAWESKSGVTT